MIKFFIWFGCGLIAGFICGLLRFAYWLHDHYEDMFEEIYEDICEQNK